MAEGVFAFMNVFGTAHTIFGDLQMMLKSVVLLLIFTNSKKVFEAILNGKMTPEQRLIIDTLAVR